MCNDMSMEIIVATMHQKKFSKLTEMNIRSDVVFANQSDETSYCEHQFPYGTAKMISTETVGVGKNRNMGLMYASGDYILFADDDTFFYNECPNIVRNAFKECPDADGIIFNLDSNFIHRKENNKIKRVRLYNSFAYGTARLAVRRSSILKKNILFSLNFGGGTRYSSGEDTLFIVDMLRSGLKLYTYPVSIGITDDTSSTWFDGYTEKYFYDMGALYYAISKSFCKMLCLQYLIRHKSYKEGGLSFTRAYRLMKQGMRGYETLKPYQS